MTDGFEFESSTIFCAVAGSHAHGMARASSDVDLRGVCILPLQRRLSLFERFEQWEGGLDPSLEALVGPALRAHDSASAQFEHAAATDPDVEVVIYDIGKFLKLCAAANPNALEILWTDPQDWLHYDPRWLRLYDQRRGFSSRKVQQTFEGYAMAQLRKIESHRNWLLSPPSEAPTRAAFGLPEQSQLPREDRDRIAQAVADRVRSYGIDDLDMPKDLRIALRERLELLLADLLQCEGSKVASELCEAATHALRLPKDIVELLAAERRYRSALKHWHSYRAWKTQRHPMRAELERRHGYDTKHAAHLLRLMRMGHEAIETGEIRVRRPDADELAAIRDGASSYDALMAQVHALRAELQAARDRCTLPAEVDAAWVDEICSELCRE